jgi:hypothetical protein
LSVDLHYLLTAWAANPLDEQVPMAWAMRQCTHADADLAILTRWRVGSRRGRSVLPTELSNEDIMRIWDALEPSYRLSTSYVARVVRLDPDVDDEQFEPVVARRLALGQEVRA